MRLSGFQCRSSLIYFTPLALSELEPHPLPLHVPTAHSCGLYCRFLDSALYLHTHLYLGTTRSHHTSPTLRLVIKIPFLHCRMLYLPVAFSTAATPFLFFQFTTWSSSPPSPAVSWFLMPMCMLAYYSNCKTQSLFKYEFNNTLLFHQRLHYSTLGLPSSFILYSME